MLRKRSKDEVRHAIGLETETVQYLVGNPNAKTFPGTLHGISRSVGKVHGARATADTVAIVGVPNILRIGSVLRKLDKGEAPPCSSVSQTTCELRGMLHSRSDIP